MVKMQIDYTGNLNCRATHGPSGTTITTAAPVDNMGDGSSFSPTDLVGTALATCILTTMAIAAKKHELELTNLSATVEKEMSPPPRKIAKLTLNVVGPKSIDGEMRQRLENAAKTCPVHKSMDHDVQMPITFSWTA